MNMSLWTRERLAAVIEDFSSISPDRRESVLSYMNRHFPPEIYEDHRLKRRAALEHMSRSKEVLHSVTQHFPTFVAGCDQTISPSSLHGHAIVFTAGGEGERLKLSLLKAGVTESALRNFTKATYALPGFYDQFGTLHTNCVMIGTLCRELRTEIPVVITTGPEGSVTASVIPELLERFDNFGLKHLAVLPQDERLFLTNDEHVVLRNPDSPEPLTHPDETGGPLMKLKKEGTIAPGTSVLDWLENLGCSRTIVVQATALYHRSVLPVMASALGTHDCLAVGILRTAFPSEDPYGTFVTIRDSGNRSRTVILEQDIRNETTRKITDPSKKYFLPFNTGLYAFRNDLLRNHDLPGFATPPKELRPDLPKAPKTGYAATDIVSCAEDPVVLTIEQGMFGVLKNSDDLERLTALGKKFGLDGMCAQFTTTAESRGPA